MSINSTQISIIFYNHKNFFIKKDNPFLSWNPESGLHQSEVASKILNGDHSRALLEKIQNYKDNGISKVEDTYHNRTIYLIPSNDPLGTSWKKLSFQQFIQKTKQPDNALFETASLLNETNILQRIERDGHVVSTIKGDPNDRTSINCQVRGSQFDPNQPSIDEAFVPEVDLATNRVTVDGKTFEITLSNHKGDIPLQQVSKSKRAQLLKAIRNTLYRTTPQNRIDLVQQATFEFRTGELNKLQFYGSDLSNPIEELEASDPALTPFKQALTSAHQAIFEVQHKNQLKGHETPIRGVPNLSQTCWLSSALHLISHIYGHHLEEMDENNENLSSVQAQTITLLKSLKRKINKEKPEPITRQDLDALLQGDPSRQQDLSEYLDLLFNDTNLPRNAFAKKVISPTKSALTTLTAPDLQGQNELLVTINRLNATGQKDSTSVDIQNRLQIGSDAYELVSAAVHHGTAAGGHYIAYSYKDDLWWKCDDANVSAADKSQMDGDLSTNGTHLVYRKIEALNQRYEDSLAKLHSTSKKDRDRWLKQDLVIDFAKQMAQYSNASVLIKTDGSSYHSGRNPSDLTALAAQVTADPNQTLFIPLLKNNQHWVGLSIDKTTATLEYFDSTGRDVPRDVTDLATALGYTVVPVLDHSNHWQNDGWRCGLYLSKYFELKAAGKSVAQIREVTELRATQPNRTEISRFRCQLQNHYNRYRPNYGFLP